MKIKYKDKWYNSAIHLWNEKGHIVKAEIIKERGYKCEITGTNYGNIEFHHIKPKSLYPHLIFDKKNIMMMATPLHQLVHHEWPDLKDHNEHTMQIFKNNYNAGVYGKIDLTTKRDYTIKDHFVVRKRGFKRNKQVYGITDKNTEILFQTNDKNKAIKKCKEFNKKYNYKIHTKKDIIEVNHCNSARKKIKIFTVIKRGFNAANNQKYAISDKNEQPIIQSVNKEKVEILCKTLNIFFDYAIDTVKTIRKWIKEIFIPYYETFYQMVSMFYP